MPLEVARADSVRRAVEALADPGARLLGGGTLVVRDYTSGDIAIRRFVLCDGLGIDQIRVGGGRAEIGAAVTMGNLAPNGAHGFVAPVANEIGGPAVRAMATVGGNLFAQSPYGDFSVALLALDAEAIVESKSGSETVPLEQFLGEREKHIGAIVTKVAFKLPPTNAFRFAKVIRRHPHGASVLSIAAVLPLANGTVSGARVAYGAMAPTAIRAKAVETAIEGHALDDATITNAVAVATDGTSPASDPFASDWYRRNVLPVHLARLLKR
jgi:CO/xanthine dehydrogenase FAD-binding subunit